MGDSLEYAIPDSAHLLVTASTQQLHNKYLPFLLKGNINVNACTDVYIELDIGRNHNAANDQVNAGRVAHFDVQLDLYHISNGDIGTHIDGQCRDKRSKESKGTGQSEQSIQHQRIDNEECTQS